jgi:hypothetical protein
MVLIAGERAKLAIDILRQQLGGRVKNPPLHTGPIKLTKNNLK